MRVLFVLAALLATPAQADLDHTAAAATNANDPSRIFGLRIPFRTGPAEEKLQLTLEASTGNSWQPTLALSYPGSYKIYGADGVIHAGTIRATQQLNRTSEVEVGLTLFALVTGTDAIDAPVSDDFITKFHTWATSKTDAFRRRAGGLNQADLIFRDREGHVGELHGGEFFLGTLDLSYVKYVELFRDDRALVTLRLGGFAALPLNKINNYLGFGIASSVAATYAFTPHVSLTAATGSTGQDDRALRVQSGGVDFSDFSTSFGYQGLLAANFDRASGMRFSVGLELEGTSAPISSKLVAGPTRASEVGFAVPQDAKQLYLGDTYRGLTSFSHDATLFVSVRPMSRRWPTVTLYVQEDWEPLPTFRGATNPYLEGGSNAQDVGFGLRIRVPIPE